MTFALPNVIFLPGGGGPVIAPSIFVPIWSAGPTMVAAWEQRGSAGASANDTIAWGGCNVGETVFSVETEIGNGVTWSHSTNFGTSRFSCPGAGTSTSACTMGGQTGPGPLYTKGDTYNGGSWTAQGTIGTNRRSCGSAGVSSTSAIIFGGGSTLLNSTELFNGSVFAAGGNLPTATEEIRGAGVTSDALSAGGDTGGSPINAVQKYNGSTWASSTVLPAVRRSGVMTGSATSNALYISGYDGSIITTTTYRFSGSAWTSLGASISARYLGSGGGTGNSCWFGAGAIAGVLSQSSEKLQ